MRRFLYLFTTITENSKEKYLLQKLVIFLTFSSTLIMDSQLKIIFSLQITAAFILLLLVIHFALGLSLLLSAGFAALASGIISAWGYLRYAHHVKKSASKSSKEEG
ncbi:MAG: hypothetical protein EA390_10900 [Balneolaceae bacterium]|nr:MAG: hypothetical protein EA390_10900 [Balneolaceae bacterium]